MKIIMYSTPECPNCPAVHAKVLEWWQQQRENGSTLEFEVHNAYKRSQHCAALGIMSLPAFEVLQNGITVEVITGTKATADRVVAELEAQC